MERGENYQLITDNPIIIILMNRLNVLYSALDDNIDAINHMNNLISAIPESMEKQVNLVEYIKETNTKFDIEKEKIKNDIYKRKGKDWSYAHKANEYQRVCKEYNILLYQLIGKKVSSLIDTLYRKEASRGKISPKVLQ